MTIDELERHGLDACLVGADRLYAVAVGDDGSEVAARDTLVLLDEDATSWSSWNAYAEELARETGARAVRISDGGITGPAFFDHVRRGRRPLINSPKGQTAPLPPDLVRRPVVTPQIYWTWSLVWRRAEARGSVLSVVDALGDASGDHGIHGRTPGCPRTTRTGASRRHPAPGTASRRPAASTPPALPSRALTCAGSLHLPAASEQVPARASLAVDFGRAPT